METAAISYRVADFLKKHHPSTRSTRPTCWRSPAADGSVSRAERVHPLAGRAAPLSGVRHPAGHGLAVGRGGGGRRRCATFAAPATCSASSATTRRAHCLYSARSESDVVIYAFPADDFEACVLSTRTRRVRGRRGPGDAGLSAASERRDPHADVSARPVGQTRSCRPARPRQHRATPPASARRSRADAMLVLDARPARCVAC